MLGKIKAFAYKIKTSVLLKHTAIASIHAGQDSKVIWAPLPEHAVSTNIHADQDKYVHVAGALFAASGLPRLISMSAGTLRGPKTPRSALYVCPGKTTVVDR